QTISTSFGPQPPATSRQPGRLTRQEGLEPPTHSLEGCCSIHLSYWRFTTGGIANAYQPRNDRGGRIRTGDLLLPKQARYRTTLRPAKLTHHQHKTRDYIRTLTHRQARPTHNRSQQPAASLARAHPRTRESSERTARARWLISP